MWTDCPHSNQGSTLYVHPWCRRKLLSTLTQNSMPCRRYICSRKAGNWSRCKWATICSHLLLMVQKWVTLYSQQWNQRSHRKNSHFPIADATDSASLCETPQAKRLHLKMRISAFFTVFPIWMHTMEWTCWPFADEPLLCGIFVARNGNRAKVCNKRSLFSSVITNNNNIFIIIDEKSFLFCFYFRIGDCPVSGTHKQLSNGD